MYYSVMSMALAEALFKQSADSRLSKLRQTHNCHGLQFTVGSDIKPESGLSDILTNMIAKPQKKGTGENNGTFEVWRQSAREHPVANMHTTYTANASTAQENFITSLFGENVPPKEIPRSGMSLLRCLKNLPYLFDILNNFSIRSDLVRAKMKTTNRIEMNKSVGIREMIVHPTSRNLLKNFCNSMVMSPSVINNIEIDEFSSGFLMRYTTNENDYHYIRWPTSICMTEQDVFFASEEQQFNEFGLLYIALHMIGNFSRYYPEVWGRHIEKSTAFSLIMDELCTHAMDRLPLLLLSELDRRYYVTHS